MTILVFCAGAPNPDLSPLNQHFDVLIGVDAGASRLSERGFTVDCAIGDFDSAPPPEHCHQIIRLPTEKDDTDLEAALMQILPRYPVHDIEKIILLGALGGGRLDHLWANLFLFHQTRFAPYLEKFYFVEQGNSLRCLRSGSHTIWREADKHYLSFIGLTPVRGLTLRDVKYPLHQRDYHQPMALISNEFLHDSMFCEWQSGLLCVVQSRDV